MPTSLYIKALTLLKSPADILIPVVFLLTVISDIIFFIYTGVTQGNPG